MKKKILFVINTLSRAGAETALLELLAQLAAERGEDGQPRYELSLFVLMNQGELVQQIPEGVRLVNPRYAQVSVLEPKGRIYMGMTVVKCLLHRANLIRLWRYHWRAARAMRKEGRLMPDKLLWRQSRMAPDASRRNMILQLHSWRAVLHTMWQTTSGRKKRRRLSISTIRRRDTAGNWTATATCNMMPYFRSGNR
mgnify:CR=1 FL=1